MKDPLDIVKKLIALSAEGHDGIATGEAAAAALKACALIRAHGFEIVIGKGKVAPQRQQARPAPATARPAPAQPPMDPFNFNFDYFNDAFRRAAYGYATPGYTAADFTIFATCFDCGKSTTEPITGRVVYCADCFKKRGTTSDEQKRREDREEQEREDRRKVRMAKEAAQAAKTKTERERDLEEWEEKLRKFVYASDSDFLSGAFADWKKR